MASNCEKYFKYSIKMALENNFSWTTLASMLEEMTPTLSKTKQLVKVLLEVLKKLQKKHLEMAPNNAQQNDKVDYQKDEAESMNKDNDFIEDFSESEDSESIKR